MPLLMLAMGVLPGVLTGQEELHTRVIGIVDIPGSVGAPLALRLQSDYTFADGRPLYVGRPVPAPGTVLAARRESDRLIAAGEVDGCCILLPDSAGVVRAEYRTKSLVNVRPAEDIEASLREVLIEHHLVALGVDPAAVKRVQASISVRTAFTGPAGPEGEKDVLKAFLSAYVFLMMLFFMILSSGQLLVRSVIEEKMNRVVEILASSCTPTQLMAGKILGLSGLGFTQMFAWLLLGLAAFAVTSVTIFPGEFVVPLLVYFILGYLLYAAIFIAAGAPVTTEQEAQQVTSYLVLILIVPIVLTIPALQDPDALWITVLTYVPLLTPTMMALRIAVQPPQAWEIALTIALMIVSIAASMVAAGRIFRIGILVTGKRPGVRELVRWVREG
jgi:ABC-2 type transport system permease protein